jgi:hypothetical protein
MVYVLILFAHVGPMGSGNSNALTNVPGFKSLAECNSAGEKVKKLVSGTVKAMEFVCVEQSK